MAFNLHAHLQCKLLTRPSVALFGHMVVIFRRTIFVFEFSTGKTKICLASFQFVCQVRMTHAS